MDARRGHAAGTRRRAEARPEAPSIPRTRRRAARAPTGSEPSAADPLRDALAAERITDSLIWRER